MPMTQDDIRTHYEQAWAAKARGADSVAELGYGDEENAVVWPIYRRLLADHRIPVEGGRILDVGCGAGRWVRLFLAHLAPARLLGIDFARSSVELLEQWIDASGTDVAFAVADVTAPDLDLGERFDLVNVGNVLFHVPEPDKFMNALKCLARHLAPGGHVVTTEYMPRASMRTEWMLVRSRYEIEAAAAAVGLRVKDVRAFSFFGNDPMGLDGPDQAERSHFHRVRHRIRTLLASDLDEGSRRFLAELFADVERAALAFCRTRIADVDLPSQKLVVLEHDDG